MVQRKNTGASTRNNLKASIETHIADLKTAEASAHKMLSVLSRELLLYVPETGDIGMVNRLLAACKTSNRDYAFLYFQNFLPWKITEEKTFGEKMPGQRVNAKKMADIAAFLSNEANDIWSWSKENVKPAERKVNYFTQVQNAVARALEKGMIEENGKERKMEPRDIIEAMRLGGVEVTAIIEASEEYAKQIEEALERKDEEAPAEQREAVH